MIRTIAIALSALIAATPALSQDVVVMRRAIAPPKPRATPAPVRCAVPEQGVWVAGGYTKIGSAASAVAALQVCHAYSGLAKGVCAWERDTKNVDFGVGSSVYALGHPDLHASLCS